MNVTEYRKAIVAALSAFVAAVTVQLSANGGNSLSDLTQLQWLVILAAVLGTFGVTYGFPNDPPTVTVPDVTPPVLVDIPAVPDVLAVPTVV